MVTRTGEPAKNEQLENRHFSLPVLLMFVCKGLTSAEWSSEISSVVDTLQSNEGTPWFEPQQRNHFARDKGKGGPLTFSCSVVYV